MQGIELDWAADVPSDPSSLRRELIERCRTKLAEVLDSVTTRYEHELAPYTARASPLDFMAVRVMASRNIEVLLTAVEEGSSPEHYSRDDPLVESMLVSGLPPMAILSARQAATVTVWRFLSAEVVAAGLKGDIPARILAETGAILFEASVRMSAGLRRRLSSDLGGLDQLPTDDLRREVFNALLLSPHLGERLLRRAAERVGYRLGEEHAVAILSADNDVASVRASIEGLSFPDYAQPGFMEPIVESRLIEVIAIYPVRDARPSGRFVDRLSGAMRTARSTDRLNATVAIGGVEAGMAGIAASYAQARRALEGARAIGSREPVSYPEMLPTLFLIDSPRLSADIWRLTVARLVAHDVEHRSDLILTLQAMVYERGNVSAAAKRIHVHRHTLGIRQEQIERLTGLQLRRHGDLLLLELGLKALELQEWEHPTQH